MGRCYAKVHEISISSLKIKFCSLTDLIFLLFTQIEHKKGRFFSLASPEKHFLSWMFDVCGQFPFDFYDRHPGFDLAEMTKLLWNQTVRSASVFGRVEAPLKTFEYWKRYYHAPVHFLLFLQQQSLHLLRRGRQRLFTPLMYRRTNLINLPQRHIFTSTIWDGVRKLGRALCVHL